LLAATFIVGEANNQNAVRCRDADGHDHAHGRRQLEVLDGLAENTGVVMNPTDDLAEGIQVQLKSAEKPKRDANAKPSSSDR
jgi:hypothetical protein